ncbi:putative radical SAM family enzyme in heat shock cluster, similarity with CPO of BS HemN-type [Desulfurella amilsii]|uniref:Heme chaperone HemW n=1 Tax=Desulfurella amilsii TaxID=1562698 RepID=A0A1X4XVJ7_9BACT|nr:radical SAM family heme chaperone HemW [Desulfurella amilsii]OSS41566.1 putative radical SAM family enzyme in heat shock cluster, similarity with CPO of BS HemN-type [Desulfurella amilsii]
MNLYVYIHIPYCYKKCPYCSFVSYEKLLNTKQNYLSALKKEIENFFSNNNQCTIQTIYIGGGTPSLLKSDELQSILDSLRKNIVSKDCEVTIEVNPNNANKTYLKLLKEMGITRVSLGTQSFNNKKLQFLNRLHDSKQSFQSVENTLEFFKNVSIDLIYGFEDFSDFQEDLKYAVSLPIKHISAYILSIERSTSFYRQKIALSEENVEKQFLYLVKFLKTHKIYQYEISNFAKKGFESKHNQAYWQNCNYVGLGLSASSYINEVRYKNTDKLDEYINKIFEGKDPIKKREKLGPKRKIKEAFILGLRTINGVNIEQFNNKYNCNIEDFFKSQLSNHYQLKTLKKINGSIKIANPKKLLISNYILSDFI